MSSQQQKSKKRMEKPVLGYAQMNTKPFSIRHYVLMSRQKNIAQSWPFSQKYLKLCCNNGISNILPPLQTRSSPTNGLNARLVIDLSLDKKQNHSFGKIRETKLDETERVSKPGEGLSLEDTIHVLCGKLGRLSLSTQGDTGKKQRSKAQNNMCDKGRRRKGKTKMKSLVEILAVAKHCVLDGNDRIVVAGCRSATLSIDELESKRKVKGKSSGLNSRSTYAKEDTSMMKKHRRSDDDSVTGIGQCNKRRRTNMGAVDYRSDGCESKSWGRKRSSYKTAETEKKPGGFERKDLETYASGSGVELKDPHGNY